MKVPLVLQIPARRYIREFCKHPPLDCAWGGGDSPLRCRWNRTPSRPRRRVAAVAICSTGKPTCQAGRCQAVKLGYGAAWEGEEALENPAGDGTPQRRRTRAQPLRLQ